MKNFKIIISLLFCSQLSSFFIASEQKNGQSPIKKSIAPYIAAIKAYFTTNTGKSSIALINNNLMPLLTYDARTKYLTLVSVDKDRSPIDLGKDKNAYWKGVIHYQLSPQKKYLLIQTTTLSEKGSSASIIARTAGGLFGKHAAGELTKIIDIATSKEIYSFAGHYITHTWSPDETSCIVATTQKNFEEQFGFKKPSKKGISENPIESRETTSGEILRYDLLDIASRSIIKTFENVQVLIYTQGNELTIQYDNKTNNEITIERNISLSLFQKMLNIFIKQPTIHVTEKLTSKQPPYTASYSVEHSQLTVTRNNQSPIIFSDIQSYQASADYHYLFINKSGEGIMSTIKSVAHAVTGSKDLNNQTIVFNVQDGTQKSIGYNIITYQFSPNGKMVLFLAPLATKTIVGEISLGEIKYQLMILESGTISSLENTYALETAYFTPENTLILVDKEGKKQPIEHLVPKERTPTLEAVKQAAQGALATVQETAGNLSEKVQQYLGSFNKQESTQAKITEQEKVEKKVREEQQKAQQQAKERSTELYQELPKALQAIVPSENLPVQTQQEQQKLHLQQAIEKQKEINKQEQQWINDQQSLENPKETKENRDFPNESLNIGNKQHADKLVAKQQHTPAIQAIKQAAQGALADAQETAGNLSKKAQQYFDSFNKQETTNAEKTEEEQQKLHAQQAAKEQEEFFDFPDDDDDEFFDFPEEPLPDKDNKDIVPEPKSVESNQVKE
jgi:hypothetical protein